MYLKSVSARWLVTIGEVRMGTRYRSRSHEIRQFTNVFLISLFGSLTKTPRPACIQGIDEAQTTFLAVQRNSSPS